MAPLTEILVFVLLMSVFALVAVAVTKLLMDAWERGAWWARVLLGDSDGGCYRLGAIGIGSGITAMLLMGWVLERLFGQF